MALRNAFANVATEATLDEIKVDQFTRQTELLEEILEQLKYMNLHLSLVTDEELSEIDIDKDQE